MYSGLLNHISKIKIPVLNIADGQSFVYLLAKKAVFSGLICVAMYLMGLVLTTDVSGAVGWADSWWARLGQTPAALSMARPTCPRLPASSSVGGS